MNRKIAGAVLAASIVGGGITGMVATTPMAAFAADTTTEATAQETARTPGQWVKDSLKGLVDKGTITQAQSDAVAQALEDARPTGGHGPGGRGPGGPLVVAKAAEVLGISEADLKTALATKSIADIAKEKNVDLQKVIDALVAAENTRIDEAVTAGKITKEQGDERKSHTVERVTNMVNNVRPAGGPGGGMGGHGGPRGGGEPPTTLAA